MSQRQHQQQYPIFYARFQESPPKTPTNQSSALEHAPSVKRPKKSVVLNRDNIAILQRNLFN